MNDENKTEPTPSMGEKRRRALEARRARKKRARWGLVFAAVALTLVGAGALGLSASWKRERNTVEAGGRHSRPLDKTPAFATVQGWGLALRLPAAESEMIALGYHQAYNTQSPAIESSEILMENATSRTVGGKAVAGRPVSFLMQLRGRGSAPTSSVDMAVKTGTPIRSPVSGRVTAVAPYLLYGVYNDIRIEIVPEGYRNIKVAMVHLDGPLVRVGQKVEAGVTPVAYMRRLSVNSQIDQYLGRVTEHVHMQINPRAEKELAASGD